MTGPAAICPPDLPPASLEAILAGFDDGGLWEQAGRDPYWPKWTSLWWRFLTLLETGTLDRLDPRHLERFATLVDGFYLHDFPLPGEKPPDGRDPAVHGLCQCALGSLLKLFHAGGIDTHARFPWMWAWVRRWQLPDGGYNCDEAAYVGSRKSSIVSTLPVVEAVLEAGGRPLPPDLAALLDRGTEYLIRHRLFRSTRGDLLDEDWLRPAFPRFYDYDVLRGLFFLARWRDLRGTLQDAAGLAEACRIALERVREHVTGDGVVSVGRSVLHGAYNRDWDGSAWQRTAPGFFPELEALTRAGRPSLALTKEWHKVHDLTA